MDRGIIIGIAGASGSGKTLVARNLTASLGAEVVMLQQDAYYNDLAELAYEERAKVNFDHPDAFDHVLLINHLMALQNREVIDHPIYDYSRHTRKSETRRIGPHKIIILEGILILAIPEIRNMLDVKIFIDTPQDICLIRRLKRDIHERGRDVDMVLEQYQETVRPMFLQFVEPSKRYADIIIPRGGKNVIAIDIVKSKFEQLLNELEH